MNLLWVVWFALGACVGSFLNVCIHRLPREQSIVWPRSRCPSCSHAIAWYDNIPLLSYLLLGGRCRHCQRPIHWRYPVVEALSGAMSAAVVSRFGMGLVGAIYLLFVWALIVVSFIDVEHQIIPDEISLGGLVVGLLLSFVVPQLHGTDQALIAARRSIIGAVVGGGLLYATGVMGGVLFRKEAMGGGDIKLLAMAGSLLGWKMIVLSFFVAPLLAVIPGLVVLFVKRSHVIPYGPFLSLALIVSLFSGEAILQISGIEETIQLLWSYYRSGT